MRRTPTAKQLEALKRSASKINSEWVTFILLSHDAAVVGDARHFKRSDLIANETRRQTGQPGEPILRPFPRSVIDHLNSLPNNSDVFCPWLHSLTRHQFHREWQKVQHAAGVHVSIAALSSPYRLTNRAKIQCEAGRATRDGCAPTDKQVELLKKAAAEISAEWVTLIALVRDAGIVIRLARHIKHSDCFGDEVFCRMRPTRFSYWRRLPTSVVKHLKTLPGGQEYVCPWLHSLSNKEVLREWHKVQQRARIWVRLDALRAKFCGARDESLRRQRVRSVTNPLVDEETVELLKQAGAKINPEWVTLILLVHDAGIMPAVARVLKRSDRVGNAVSCKFRSRQYPVRRRLPDNVVAHLDSLEHCSEFYCPWLRSLNRQEFKKRWQQLQARAQRYVPIGHLCFAYRKNHADQIKWERAEAVLEALARQCTKQQWVTTEELAEIQEAARRWIRLPAKHGQRGRRRTRKQLLAGIPKQKESDTHTVRSLLD